MLFEFIFGHTFISENMQNALTNIYRDTIIEMLIISEQICIRVCLISDWLEFLK